MNPPIPHPHNVLGLSILPTATEAALIADGMRFATVLLSAGQRDRAGYIRKRPLVLCGRRCPDMAARDGLRDWMRSQMVADGIEQKAAA